MTDAEFERIYSRIRPLINKIDDSDPCSIEHIDMDSDPVIVRLRCDDSSTIIMKVSVQYDSE